MGILCMSRILLWMYYGIDGGRLMFPAFGISDNITLNTDVQVYVDVSFLLPYPNA